MAWLRRTVRHAASAAPGLTVADRPAPRAWVDSLHHFLAPLDSAGRGTARVLCDVVLTGEPSGGFTQVGPGTAAHSALDTLLSTDGVPPAGLSALLAGLPDVRPDVVVRFGRLLGLGLAGRPWLYHLDLPPGAEWAESVLVTLDAVRGRNHGTRAGSPRVVVPLDVLERAVEAAGLPAHTLLAAAFSAPASTTYGSGAARSTLRTMPGYDAAVARHAGVLRTVTVRPGVTGRLTSVEMLAPVDEATLRLFVDELAQLATSTSTQVRQAATPLLTRLGGDAVPFLRTLSTTGKPDQRLQALRLLWPLADAPTRQWAREHAAQDSAPSVRSLLHEWDEGDAVDDELPLAPPTPIDWHVTVDAALIGVLDDLWERCEAAARRSHEDAARHAAAYEQQTGRKATWLTVPQPLDARWRKDVHRALAAGTPPSPVYHPLNPAVAQLVQKEGLPRELGTVALVVVLNHLGLLLNRPDDLSWAGRGAIELHHHATGRPTLLELARMIDEMGADGGSAVYRAFSAGWSAPLGDTWSTDAVAPFVAAYLDLVTASLAGAQRDYTMSPDAPYRALRTLPRLPRRVVDALLATALTGARADRRPAQDALHDVVGKEARILSALADGKADVRTEAARWLSRLRPEAAVPALEAAVAKEKHDVAKGAMLDALQALGQPVEKYLDRQALAVQAAAAVAKGLPKELGWLNWSAVPTVHWADDGSVVPLETVQWLVAQSVRAKSPEPNALLRKYCGMFQPRDREALGQHLLESWLVEDVRPIDPDEAMRLAAQDASGLHQWAAHDPDDRFAGMTVEQITEHILPGHLRRPGGSLIGAKGLLAVVAACAGARAAAPVGRYLEEWYGTRAAQGKALIAMLAWVDHPSAVQLVLSVGSRFRTRSFQEEATRQAAALAERKGWTLDELADRTIPTAGLDATGTLRLPYGDRVFTAELQPDLTLRLRSPDGRPISALPTPRRTDDAELAAASRVALQHARKELKQVVQLQTLRLYEAMCTDRTWSAEDWQQHLLGHPVVRHLAQRVVWLATDGDADPSGTGEDASVHRTVRPLEDGTLTDVADDDVSLPPAARVRVAHGSLLDADDVRAWVAHLADYEVQPLFPQLDRAPWSLPDSDRGATELTDFTGHLVESFALRNRAGRLGYTRGAPEDGGWFVTYEKRFPTLGLTSVVTFSGSPLPEESRTVALETLSVVRTAPDGRAGGPVPLGQVPPVLLAEAYADIRELAAAGTGFDPDWQRKVKS